MGVAPPGTRPGQRRGEERGEERRGEVVVVVVSLLSPRNPTRREEGAGPVNPLLLAGRVRPLSRM